MRLLLTGGGTGGHIYPAIAIANRVKREDRDAEILFVGTERGKEKELVPAAGYEIRYISVRGLSRKHMLKNVSVAAEYLKAIRESGKILDEFQPDAVLGTGGYVSAPVLRAAAGKKIPVFIQEQNAAPGLTNKMLEKYANFVFLGFREASEAFKYPEKHLYTGNPVRAEFFSARKQDCRERLGIPKDDFVLLAFGGSQGAGRINKAMVHVTKAYNNMPGVTVVFVPGQYYHLPVMTEITDGAGPLGDNVRVEPYLMNMQEYLPASDLVISRSGALAVTEIAVTGKASVLIPSPIVTGDHQLFNARVLSKRGAAVLLEEKEMTDEGLLELIETLRRDPERLGEMGRLAREAAPGDGTDIIWEVLKD